MKAKEKHHKKSGENLVVEGVWGDTSISLLADIMVHRNRYTKEITFCNTNTVLLLTVVIVIDT